LRFDFGLHTPVKFYPDPLRFAGVVREKADFEQSNRLHAKVADFIAPFMKNMASKYN